MYAFTQDGKHLVIQDGFGLTRVTFPKSVKTDRALGGNKLSLGGNHVLAFAAKSHKFALRTADALLNERWAASNYGSFALHPDDEHAIELAQNSLTVWRSTTKSERTHKWPEALATAMELDLGRQRPADNSLPELGVFGADGTLAHYRPSNAAVFIGRMLSVESFEPRFRVTIGRPVGSLILHPSADETFIGAYDRGLRRATIVRIDAKGESQQWEIEALGAPSFSGTYWCWQRDAETLCRADWREMDKPERMKIPSGFEGSGTVMAHADRVYFLSADRERIADVLGDKVIDRKLGAKDQPARERVMKEYLAFDGWLADEGGALDFGHVEVRAKSKSIDWSPTFDLGTASFSANLAVGELLGRQRHSTQSEGSLSVGSYSPPASIGHTALEDVVRGISALEAHDGLLLRALCGLEHSLETYFEPPYEQRTARGIAAPPRLFEPAAATALLRAAFVTMEKRQKVSLVANLAKWSKTPFTAAELAEQHCADDLWDGPKVFSGAGSVPLVLAYLALDLLRAEVLPVFIQWMVERPSGFAEANSHIVSRVVARMVQYFPETDAPFREACARSQGEGSQGASMLQSLKFELRE